MQKDSWKQWVEKYQTTVSNKNASTIELLAALNMENLPNFQATLQKTTAVTFSLSLWERRGDKYEQVSPDSAAQERIAFQWQDGSSNWSWTINKNAEGQFTDGKGKTALDLFDSGKFSFPLTAYVFTDQTDFANYQIKLSVSFLDTNDAPVSVSLDDKDAYVVYTYACIKPTFYDPNPTAGS